MKPLNKPKPVDKNRMNAREKTCQITGQRIHQVQAMNPHTQSLKQAKHVCQLEKPNQYQGHVVKPRISGQQTVPKLTSSNEKSSRACLKTTSTTTMREQDIRRAPTYAAVAGVQDETDGRVIEWNRRAQEHRSTMNKMRNDPEAFAKLTRGTHELLSESEQLVNFLHNDTKKKDETIAEQRKKLQEQDLIVQAVQEKAFTTASEGQWLKMDDSVIGAKLQSIETLIQGFSKQRAKRGLSGETLVHNLLKHAKGRNAFLPEAGVIALEVETAIKTGIHVCLSAWLCHFVYEQIFNKPFFFLDALEANLGSQGLGASMQEGLRKFLMVTSQYYGNDVASLHTLRSDMSRIVNPVAADDEPEIRQKFRGHLSEARSKQCRELAREFSAKAKCLFEESVPVIIEDKLFEIMSAVAAVSAALHVQRSRVVLYWVHKLPPVFDPEHAHVVEHFVHTAQEENVTGKNILVVSHPCVIAIGKSDGSDCDTQRVLKRATVWMGKHQTRKG